MIDRSAMEVERKYWLIRPEDQLTVPLAMAEFQSRIAPVLAEFPDTRLHIFDGHDTYLRQPDFQGFVRVRTNLLRSEMTAKTIGTPDSERRPEVNLKVTSPEEDQVRFLELIGFQQVVTVRQSGNVYIIPGRVEIVVYRTERLPGLTDPRAFVEIEALGGVTVDEAVALVDDFERRLGLSAEKRCRQSIYALYGLSLDLVVSQCRKA